MATQTLGMNMRALDFGRPPLLLGLAYQLRALLHWRAARYYRRTCGSESFTREEIQAAAALVNR